MSYLRSFAPWILYAVLSSFDWRVGTGAAAIAAVALVIDERRHDDFELLTMATCGFFVVMAVIALAAPHSGLHHWMHALSAGVLAVIAFGSLAARQPFTLPIAKRSTPEEYWNTPRFLHINDVITAAWAVCFAASAIVCALIVHSSPNATTPLTITQIAGFVVPAVFTKRYSDRQRAAASGAAA